MGLGDAIIDAFSTSQNEAKRNEYRKLKEALNSKKKKIERLLQAAEEHFESAAGVEDTQGKDLAGKPFEVFDAKAADARMTIRRIIDYMGEKLAAVQPKIAAAEELQNHYQRLCDEEDKDNGG